MLKKILYIFFSLILLPDKIFSQSSIGINNQFNFDFQKYQKHIYYSPGFLFEKKFTRKFSLVPGFDLSVLNYKYKCNDCPGLGNASSQQDPSIGYYDYHDRYVLLIVPVSTRFYPRRNQHEKLKPYWGFGMEANFSIYEKHSGSYFKRNGNVIDPGPYYFSNHKSTYKTPFNGVLFNFNWGATYSIKKKFKVDVNPVIRFFGVDNNGKAYPYGYFGLNVSCFYKLE